MKKSKKEEQSIVSKFVIALQDPARFKLLKDGWIKDSLTGLDLGPTSEKAMNLTDAIKYCAEKGGRLPSIEEFYSIVNSANDPCYYPIFKDTRTDNWYWSGSITPWNKSAARCVSFGNGSVFNNFDFHTNYVRPVRASQ